MKNNGFFGLAALLLLLAAAPARLPAQDFSTDAASTGTAPTTTTVTNATATIIQTNYSSNGTVEGFLVGASAGATPTILLEFSSNVTGGIGTLGVAGNSIVYSGTATTNSAGFQTVHVTSFTNNTTKATYTATTPGTTTATTYGPTSGTVRQLNYDDNGSIDGFLFVPSGGSAAILVVTGSQASATLKPLLTVGATVSVTGASHAAAANATIPTLTVVNANSLTVGGQTIVIAGGGFAPGAGRGGPGGHR